MSLSKVEAKRICRKCRKYPRIFGRVFCQKCFDIKQEVMRRREEKYNQHMSSRDHGLFGPNQANPIRRKISEFAVKHHICSRCLGRYTEYGLKQCVICMEAKRLWVIRYRDKTKAKRLKPVGKPKSILTDKEKKERHREYLRRYRRKKLVEKVRKLDIIQHSVEK